MHLLGLAPFFWQPWDEPLLMVKICCPVLQHPVPLSVAYQTRQCGHSSSTDSFVSRKQLARFLYLCTIRVPWLAVPCSAMPFGRAVIFPFCGTTAGETQWEHLWCTCLPLTGGLPTTAGCICFPSDASHIIHKQNLKKIRKKTHLSKM